VQYAYEHGENFDALVPEYDHASGEGTLFSDPFAEFNENRQGGSCVHFLCALNYQLSWAHPVLNILLEIHLWTTYCLAMI